MAKRDYKITGEDGYFHAFNRGNNLQNIFLDDEDYKFFIFKLKQNIFPDEGLKRMRPLPLGSYSILSYCLMPNHFHLLLRQNAKYPIQQLLLRVCTSYSMYFNNKHKRKGHIFQDRFKQAEVEDDKYTKVYNTIQRYTIQRYTKVCLADANLVMIRWIPYGKKRL